MFNFKVITEKLSRKKYSRGRGSDLLKDNQGIATSDSAIFLNLDTKSSKKFSDNDCLPLQSINFSYAKKGKLSERYYNKIDLKQKSHDTANKRKDAPGSTPNPKIMAITKDYNDSEISAPSKPKTSMQRRFMGKKRKIRSVDSREIAGKIEKNTSKKSLINNEIHDQRNYVDAIATSKNTILLALYPNTKIHFHGNIWLKLILGKSTILGYDFKVNESYPILSPAVESLMYIYASEGEKVKLLDLVELQNLDIPEHWIKSLPINENEHVAIFEISKYISRSVCMLNKVSLLTAIKPLPIKDKLWHDVLGTILVEDKHPTILKEPKVWEQFVKKLKTSTGPGSQPFIVITGGKGVGKSTFLRYVINSLLNQTNEVACVDLDPGKPEFSLPSCLSLSVINTPLLGPSSLHLDNLKLKWQKQEFWGQTTVDMFWGCYIEKVAELVAEARLKDMPVVINTMGYTANVGFDIMVDLLRTINPTHVVTLESVDPQNNFSNRLQPTMMSIIMKSNILGPRFLDYELTIIPSQSTEITEFNSRQIRDLRIMSFLSSLWCESETNIVRSTIKDPVILPLKSVGLYDLHYSTSKETRTKTLYGLKDSLVALCNINEEYLLEDNSGFPMLSDANSDWFKKLKFIQWGIISKIDSMDNILHILTPLPQEALKRDVNFIVKPKNQKLPKMFDLRDSEHVTRINDINCSSEEWNEVYAAIFANSLVEWKKAYDRIELWRRSESHLPIEIEATYQLLTGLIYAEDSVEDKIKLALYISTIIRFDVLVKKFKGAEVSKKSKQNYSILPRPIIELRNAIAHRYSFEPSPMNLRNVRNLILSCLHWMKSHYWDKTVTADKSGLVNEPWKNYLQVAEISFFTRFWNELEVFQLSRLEVCPVNQFEICKNIAEAFSSYCKVDLEDAVRFLVHKFFNSFRETEFNQSLNEPCCDIPLSAEILCSMKIIMEEIDKQGALPTLLRRLTYVIEYPDVCLSWIRVIFVSHFPSRFKVCTNHRFFVSNNSNTPNQSAMWKRIVKYLMFVGEREQMALAVKIAEWIAMPRSTINKLKEIFEIYVKNEENSCLGRRILTVDDVLIAASNDSEEMASYVKFVLNESAKEISDFEKPLL